MLAFLLEGSAAVNHRCAKGHQGKFGYFETLYAKRNSNQRTAQQYSIRYGRQSQRNSTDDEPDHIGNEGHGIASVQNILPKGTEHEAGKFEALASNGNPDNSQAPKDSCQTPAKALPQSTAQKPDDISKASHHLMHSFPVSN